MHTDDELATIALPRALTELGTSRHGLTSPQARERLRRYAPNENDLTNIMGNYACSMQALL